jgi:hypothetical protein
MRSLLLAVLIFAAPAAPAQTMEPGMWEFSTTLSGAALPKPQSATASRCISKQDADDPTRFSDAEPTPGCTVKPGARTPDSYQWTLACPQQGVTGEGKVRFTPRAIDAEIRTTVMAEGKKVEMLSRVTGRLTGPCTAK